MPISISSPQLCDDSKLYMSFSNQSDAQILQESLNSLYKWTEQWQLKISIDKCAVLHLGHHNQKMQYFINNVPIPSVDCIRDLGVHIDNNLSFSAHISSIIKKAYSIINALFRCFSTDTFSALLMSYISFVRPHLEYCSVIFNPMLQKKGYIGNCRKLEKVQKYFTRRLCRRCHIPYNNYNDRLLLCKLDTLEFRRLCIDLIYMYKMQHNLLGYDFKCYFNQKTSRTRGNPVKVIATHSNLLSHANMFFIRIIDVWNSLPEEIVNAANLSVFKRRIYSFDLSPFLSSQ